MQVAGRTRGCPPLPVTGERAGRATPAERLAAPPPPPRTARAARPRRARCRRGPPARGPTSNCGFTSTTTSRAGASSAAAAGRICAQRDERDVDRSPRSARLGQIGSGARWRALMRSSTTTRGSLRSRSCELAAADVDARRRARRRAAAGTSVKPPVEAPTSSARRPAGSSAKASSAPASFTPPRPTYGCSGLCDRDGGVRRRRGVPGLRRARRRRCTRPAMTSAAAFWRDCATGPAAHQRSVEPHAVHHDRRSTIQAGDRRAAGRRAARRVGSVERPRSRPPPSARDALEPVAATVGGLARRGVLAGGLAETLRGASGVEDVVHDLEGQADRGAVAPQRLPSAAAAPPQARRPPRTQAESSAPVLARWSRSSVGASTARPSDSRSSTCPPISPPVRRPRRARGRRRRGAAARRERPRRATAGGRRAVSRASPARMAMASPNTLCEVGLPRRRSSSSMRGQVVVDQAVGVDHLHGAGRIQQPRRRAVRRGAPTPRPRPGPAAAGCACRPRTGCSAWRGGSSGGQALSGGSSSSALLARAPASPRPGAAESGLLRRHCPRARSGA